MSLYVPFQVLSATPVIHPSVAVTRDSLAVLIHFRRPALIRLTIPNECPNVAAESPAWVSRADSRMNPAAWLLLIEFFWFTHNSVRSAYAARINNLLPSAHTACPSRWGVVLGVHAIRSAIVAHLVGTFRARAAKVIWLYRLQTYATPAGTFAWLGFRLNW